MIKLKILLLCGVVLAAYAGCGRDAPGSASTAGARLEIDPEGSVTDLPEPDRYRIVYEVEQAGMSSTERVTVLRPYASRVESYSGRPPGDDLLSVRTSRVGSLATRGQSSSSLLVVPPSLASGDLRARDALEAAADAGQIERLGTASVEGRRCTAYRTGGPVGAGYLTPHESHGVQHADVCVDAIGLVVDERWFEGDDLLRRRTAVEVETELADLRASDGEFTLEGAAEVSAADGGGTLTSLTSDSRLPEGFWEPVDRSGPLARFTHERRWAVISPNVSPQSSVATEQDGRRATIVDVWRDGIDVVLIEQGATLDGTSPFEPHPTADMIDLGELGEGEAILDLRLSEVRAMTSSASFVRVGGTIHLEDIATIARSLRKQPGGALVALEQP